MNIGYHYLTTINRITSVCSVADRLMRGWWCGEGREGVSRESEVMAIILIRDDGVTRGWVALSS